MKTITRYSILAVLLAGFSLLLAACGSSSGSGASGGTGTLSLNVTDGPVYTADHVYIQFHGIELQPSSGGRITLYYCQDPMDAAKTVVSETACTTPAAPEQLDLLALNGGLTGLLLDTYTLPAGRYDWIRLMVDTGGTLDSYVADSTGDHELTIPSGAETGLKLNRGFDVAADGHADFTVDFDLSKSIHVTGTGEYMLRPTLRLVDSIETGSIAGTVSSSLITTGCTPAVYVFAGQNVTPDDIDGIVPDPVTTAMVKLDIYSGEYKYKAAFLEPGAYTVAFTCQAAQDDPSTDDAIGFSGAANVTVSAQTVTPYNF
ncbi:MAG: DUF4382 domain-containing protein [Burkholderiales bacterium]